MSTRKKLGVWASSAILAILATILSANAANCKLKGNWFFDNMRIQGTSSGPSVSVNACILSVDDNGAFSGPCTAYNIGQSLKPLSINGSLVVDSSCSLRGSTFIPVGPDVSPPFSIANGYMNGDTATGVTATNDPISTVRLFNLIRIQ